MSKSCAYCGNPPPFTREHIWPSGILKRGDFGIRFSARANKTFEGDLTIADVCADCNNGPLSALDAHVCELYDRRFAKRVEPGAVVTFTYDYGLLMRWLLKISYNSARTTGQDAELLSGYRDTILSTDACSPVFVVAFLATVAPSETANQMTGKTGRMYPLSVARCGPMRILNLDIGDQAVLRCVMINAFYFTLIITRSSVIDRRVMSSIRAGIPGQPLDLSGRMRVGPPSIPAHVALSGVEAWPRLPTRK